MRSFAHTGKRNPLRNRDYILRVGRHPGPNHACNFGDDRLRGLGVARGRISSFPIDLRPIALHSGREIKNGRLSFISGQPQCQTSCGENCGRAVVLRVGL